MKSIWILGKNKSIDSYPKGLFGAHETVGLNQASVTFKTNWAFSPYVFLIRDFIAAGFTAANIIGLDPQFDLPFQKSEIWPHKYPGLTYYLKYNNHTPAKDSDADDDCFAAIGKDLNWNFHNTGTAVHLLLHWLVIHDYRRIELFGTNQTLESGKGFDDYPDTPDFNENLRRRREYLELLIKTYKQYEVEIILYENFEDFVKKGGQA